MGAIILSVLISFLWMRTAWSEFKLLVGVSADADFLRFVTYVCKSSHTRTHPNSHLSQRR